LLLHQLQQALDQSETYAQALEAGKEHLEEQVTNRTKELQLAFDVTNQVSKIIISSPEQTSLFTQVGELIQKTIDAHRVRIYLRDTLSDTLVLQFSLPPDDDQGDINQARIAWGQGIVGAAAGQKALLAVENVALNSGVVSTAMEAQAELAIPLQKDEQVFGVLDILRDRQQPFYHADQALMQIVANQLSVAMTNLHLIDETRQALERVEALNRRLIQGRWEATLKQKHVLGYAYTPLGVSPTDDDWLPGMVQVLDHDDESATGSVHSNELSCFDNELAVPVKLRGEIVGVLGMTRDGQLPWTRDEYLIAQSIAGQIGLALENARLFEETSRRAGREKVIADMTRQIWSSENLERVMQTAVAQFGQVLSASKVVIQLGTEDQLLAMAETIAQLPTNGPS
jgi:GAF domain-containing protein